MNTELPENKGKILNYLDKYLKTGGYPEVVIKDFDLKPYLETLFDAVIFKDIIKRYRVRYSTQIYDIAIFLMWNFASELSYTKIKNIVGLRSTSTAVKFISYLEEAYIFFILNRFSYKVKQQINTPKKIYVSDNGTITAKAFQITENRGKFMENLIFCELLRRGYKNNINIFYYKTLRSGLEVDFIIKDALKVTQLIQVCSNIGDFKTREREIKALIKAAEELDCGNLIIITWDLESNEKYGGKEINFIPLWKFLTKL